MKKKDFITLSDYSSQELIDMLDLADEMKKNPKKYGEALQGKALGMIFSKSSTRTRISFQTGIFQLGGIGLYFGANDLQLSRGEMISDTAKVLSRYLDAIMIRTFSYRDVQELAACASIPVINGLTDYNHPCQAMADAMTIREKFGKLAGLKLAYVGDGNNVALSLMVMSAKLALHVSVVSPRGYWLPEEEREKTLKCRKDAATEILFTEDVQKGVRGANIVYTDTWVSMGQEKEGEKKLKEFRDYQVNEKLMSYAERDAIFMHCLPAHRGEEVAASVIDGPQSVVFDEAENRLHVQKAILYILMRS